MAAFWDFLSNKKSEKKALLLYQLLKLTLHRCLYFFGFFTRWNLKLRSVSNTFWTKIPKAIIVASLELVKEWVAHSRPSFFQILQICSILCTTVVIIFCVEFRELSHLTRDFFQTKKEITVVTSWATDKMTTIFTQNDNSTILSEIDIILCICSACNNI